jgi:hypothetical protein
MQLSGSEITLKKYRCSLGFTAELPAAPCIDTNHLHQQQGIQQPQLRKQRFWTRHITRHITR